MKKIITVFIVLVVIVIGVFFIFKKPALLPEQKPYSSSSSLNSPFGIGNPKIPVSDPSLRGVILPAGYDYPQDVMMVGAKWSRYSGVEGLVWDSVEKEKGRYDWRESDYKFLEAKKAGLNLMVTIDSFNRWDQPKAGGNFFELIRMSPNDKQAYYKFLEKSIERYDGDGIDDAQESPVINYWQIENEVDFDLFWRDTPENYAKLLKDSYKIIKKVNPNAKILIAGMSDQIGLPNEQKSYNYYSSILKELRSIMDKHGDSSQYFDIFDIHLFNFKDDAQIQNTVPHLKKIKDELKTYGLEKIPIWITETADFSGKPIGQPETLKKDEAQQAKNLIKIYTYSLAHGVQKIFWVTLTEWFGFGGIKNSIWDNVGLVNNPQNDGESHKKLSYYTYKKMVEVLEGSDWDNIETVQETGGVYVYKFMKAGKPIWVAWNDNDAEKQIVIAEIGSSSVKITEAAPNYSSGKEVVNYDTAFSTKMKNVGNGKVMINIKDMPVFVEEN